MAQTKKLLFWIAAVSASIGMNCSDAQSALITRDVTIDLDTDGRIKFFQGSNDAWEGIVPISPISFTQGDTLLVKIRFENDRAIRLSDIDGLTNPNSELTKLTIRPNDNASQTPTNVSWNISGIFRYIGTGGELLSNPTPFSITGGGGAIQGPFHNINLTNSSFVYHGIDLELNFAFFELRRGTGVFDTIEWSSGAENVQIVDWIAVPEPSTFTLFVLGLFALSLALRR